MGDQISGIVQEMTTELMSPDSSSWVPLSHLRSCAVGNYPQVLIERCLLAGSGGP